MSSTLTFLSLAFDVGLETEIFVVDGTLSFLMYISQDFKGKCE